MFKSAVALTLVILPHAYADKPALGDLQKQCAVSWSKYRGEMDKFQGKAQGWIKDLSKAQVTDLYDNDDQLVLFISATFPELLDGKYDGWESFKSCSELNWKLLRDMSDRATNHDKAMDQLSDCFKSRYSNGTKLLPPFDRVLTCYTHQSAQFHR